MTIVVQKTNVISKHISSNKDVLMRIGEDFTREASQHLLESVEFVTRVYETRGIKLVPCLNKIAEQHTDEKIEACIIYHRWEIRYFGDECERCGCRSWKNNGAALLTCDDCGSDLFVPLEGRRLGW